MKFLRLTFLLLMCAAFPLLGYATQAEKPVLYTLSNGMRVLLDPFPTSDKVFGGIVVNVGGKHESPDATGLAHYQEHMLFKGTEELGTSDWAAEKPHIDKIFALYDQLGRASSKKEVDSLQKAINAESVAASKYVIVNEFDKLIKQAGGTAMNATTSWDGTVYFNAFPASEMEKWMALYAHRFERPVFRGFQAELEVVYEEQNAAVDNIASRVYEQFLAAFYPHHPYGSRSLIGTIDHLKRPSLTKMRDFFNTYYVPNNMMLVLSGNFEVEQAKSLIERYFGKWQSKPLPTYTPVKEPPFKGRQVVSVRSFPIRAGALSFRDPELTPQENVTEDILTALLTNSAETGKLDSLSLSGKVMAALALRFPLAEQSGLAVVFVPKIFGQQFSTAERFVWWAIDDLRMGRFSDTALAVAKLSKLMEWEKNMEEPALRFAAWSEMSMKGQTMADVLDYKERLNAVTREDIVALANRLFQPNYLLFRNKMGFAGGEKIAKPDYKPVIAAAKGTSRFADSLNRIPSLRSEWTPITEGKEYTKRELARGGALFAAPNPINDIFTLRLQYYNYPPDFVKKVSYLEAMDNAAPDGLTLQAFKEQLGLIGASISVAADSKSLIIAVQGLEEHYAATIDYLQRFLASAHLDKQEKETVIRNAQAAWKVQRKSAEFQVEALEEYARRGKGSSYLQSATFKELRSTPPSRFDSIFQDALAYPCDVYYVGRKSADELVADCQRILPKVQNAAVVPQKEEWQPTEDVDILFFANKKATQAKISILQRVEDYTPQSEPYRMLLNSYLSDGFSGLLLQEIREFRSLAYTTYGYLNYPFRPEFNTFFQGKLETQGDKTLEALELYLRLVDSMPAYPERLPEAKTNIINRLAQIVPSFRSLPKYAAFLDRIGFKADPRLATREQLPGISWEQFYAYYQRQFGARKRLITIVGDPRTINLKRLKERYRVREVKLKDLVRN